MKFYVIAANQIGRRSNNFRSHFNNVGLHQKNVPCSIHSRTLGPECQQETTDQRGGNGTFGLLPLVAANEVGCLPFGLLPLVASPSVSWQLWPGLDHLDSCPGGSVDSVNFGSWQPTKLALFRWFLTLLEANSSQFC